jgi:hypothetical protein
MSRTSKHTKLRKNPYLETRSGYLVNPQTMYSQSGEKSIVWLHTTYIENPDDWRPDVFKPHGNNFYIGAGANTEFGNDLVFVKYKPRKIFDYEELFEYDRSGRHVPSKSTEVQQFMDCLFEHLMQSDSETKNTFIDNHKGLVPLSSDVFSELHPDEIKTALRKGLYTSCFKFFENDYVQECLKKFGYTAYFESETMQGVDAPSDEINIAVLESDFDRVKIVGLVTQNRSKGSYKPYKCPSCDYPTDMDDIIQGTVANEESIMCLECHNGADCDICGKRTRSSQFEIEEFFRDERTVAICRKCVKNRQCQCCEKFFEENELQSTEYADRVCTQCHAENEEEDEDY